MRVRACVRACVSVSVRQRAREIETERDAVNRVQCDP